MSSKSFNLETFCQDANMQKNGNILTQKRGSIKGEHFGSWMIETLTLKKLQLKKILMDK